AGLGAEPYEQLKGRVTEPLAGIETLDPPLTLQRPPLSTASLTLAVIASQSLGLLMVIAPVAIQALSVPASWVTVTVEVKVAVPPSAMLIRVWAASLAMFQWKVRVNVVAAVLLTVRSLPTQTVTVFEALPVVPVVLVLKVAVLSWLVQVPAGSPLKVCE